MVTASAREHAAGQVSVAADAFAAAIGISDLDLDARAGLLAVELLAGWYAAAAPFGVSRDQLDRIGLAGVAIGAAATTIADRTRSATDRRRGLFSRDGAEVPGDGLRVAVPSPGTAIEPDPCGCCGDT